MKCRDSTTLELMDNKCNKNRNISVRPATKKYFSPAETKTCRFRLRKPRRSERKLNYKSSEREKPWPWRYSMGPQTSSSWRNEKKRRTSEDFHWYFTLADLLLSSGYPVTWFVSVPGLKRRTWTRKWPRWLLRRRKKRFPSFPTAHSLYCHQKTSKNISIAFTSNKWFLPRQTEVVRANIWVIMNHLFRYTLA